MKKKDTVQLEVSTGKVLSISARAPDELVSVLKKVHANNKADWQRSKGLALEEPEASRMINTPFNK